MKRPVAVAVALLLVLLGCSPTIRVELRFKLPAGADLSRLHVRGRATCPRSTDDTKKPEPPPPGRSVLADPTTPN